MNNETFQQQAAAKWQDFKVGFTAFAKKSGEVLKETGQKIGTGVVELGQKAGVKAQELGKVVAEKGKELIQKIKQTPQEQTINLDELLQKENTQVPQFLQDCAFRIVSKIELEGIFRVPPNEESYQINKNRLRNGIQIDLNQIEVYEVCSLFKHFLRSISPNLLSPCAAELRQGRNNFSQTCEALKQLSVNQKVCLKFLLTLLNQVQKSQDQNKMTAKNLSIVFAPNLFDECIEGDPEVVEFLISFAAEIQEAI